MLSDPDLLPEHVNAVVETHQREKAFEKQTKWINI